MNFKKNKKNGDAPKKRSGMKSMEAGRESMVGKICKRGRFEPGVKETGSYGW